MTYERPIRKLIKRYKDGDISFDELKTTLATYPYKRAAYSPPDSMTNWEDRVQYVDEHLDGDDSGTWGEVSAARPLGVARAPKGSA